MSNRCYFNGEVDCHCGKWVKARPDRAELHCKNCGWYPPVERKRREEVKARYGKKL